MLKVNGIPVVSGSGIVNKIVLTDTAYSELSVVHLPKNLAPVKNQFVWVTIHDPDYNRNNPESNQYMLARWMFVDQVLFLDYADPYVRGENGEVTYDEDDKPIRRSLRESDGIVKVILRETKHTLTFPTVARDYNIPGKLPLVVYGNYNAAAFPFRNQITLEKIAEMFSSMGSLFEYAESDIPPEEPYNLFWSSLSMADCLNDLLRSYSCRVVESPNLHPNDSEVREYDPIRLGLDDYRVPQFNKITWKRRSYVDFDDTIIYNNIAYQEDTDEFREYDKARTQFAFPSIQNRDQLLLPEGSTNPAPRRITFDKAYNVDDPANLLTFLKSTHINYDLTYAFETQRLPASFLDEKDWSRIRYEFYYDSYTIFVEHLPRQVPSVPGNYTLQQDTPELWTGRIAATSGHSVTLVSCRTLNPEIYDGSLVDPITIPLPDVDPSSVGDKVYFMVAENTVVPLSFSSAFNMYADDLVAPPMHNGAVVLGIKHTIPGLVMACDDEVLASGRDPIYDYTFDSYTLNPLATSLNEFVFPTDIPTAEDQKWFFKVPDYRYWVYVRFRLKATQEELTQFVKDQDQHDFGNEYNETLAEIWFKTMQYIGMYFTFTQNPYELNWTFQYAKPSNTYNSTDLNGLVRTPEIVTQQFNVLGRVLGLQDTQPTFPLYRGNPNTDERDLTLNMGSVVSNNALSIRRSTTVLGLGRAYIVRHLHTFGGEIDLVQ